jgi:hypothetical protein
MHVCDVHPDLLTIFPYACARWKNLTFALAWSGHLTRSGFFIDVIDSNLDQGTHPCRFPVRGRFSYQDLCEWYKLTRMWLALNSIHMNFVLLWQTIAVSPAALGLDSGRP